MKSDPITVRRIWAADSGDAGLVKLPQEVLERANCEIGDIVVVYAEPGSITLVPLRLASKKLPKAPVMLPAGACAEQGEPTRGDEPQLPKKKAAEAAAGGIGG